MTKPFLFDVSTEPLRTLGGVGAFLRQLYSDFTLAQAVPYRCLCGPLILPDHGDCRGPGALKTIDNIQNQLRTGHIRLHYPYADKCPPLKRYQRLGEKLRRVEHTHNVGLYFGEYVWRGIPGPLYFLTVDVSSKYASVHQHSDTNLIELIDALNQHGIELGRPEEARLLEFVKMLLLNPSRSLTSEDKEKLLKRKRWWRSLTDTDYDLGLLMARPLEEAIGATVATIGREFEATRAIVIAHDYLGIPTLERVKQRASADSDDVDSLNSVTTVMYCTEVRPVRYLVEKEMRDKSSEAHGGKGERPYVLEPGQWFGEGRYFRLLLDAHKESFPDSMTKSGMNHREWGMTKLFRLLALAPPDVILANSSFTAGQLQWMIADGVGAQVREIPSVPHGIVIPSSLDGRRLTGEDAAAAKREIFEQIKNETSSSLSGARSSWSNNAESSRELESILDSPERTLLFIKIARPEPCKAIERDLLVVSQIARQLSSKNKNVLFLAISSWDEEGNSAAMNYATDGLPRSLHEKCQACDVLAEERRQYSHYWAECWIETIRDSALGSNAAALLVNSFNWPQIPNSICDGRELLLTAADASLGQSTYESFGIAQLEPLPFGCVCTISRASGAYDFLAKYKTSSALAVADYSLLGQRDLNARTPREMKNLEAEVASKVAGEILQRLSIPREKRQEDALAICRESLDWSTIAKLYTTHLLKLEQVNAGGGPLGADQTN
jgi:hypothetical protein